MGKYHVKGSSIVSKLTFVRERLGAEAERGVMADLEARDIRYLLEGSWYPFEVYDAVLRGIAERHFGGDVRRLREVGEFSAEHALSGTYDVFGGLGSFERFLERVPQLHKRLYDAGDIAIRLDPGGEACHVELRGAPTYTDADLWVSAGFYAGVARLMGCREVGVQLEHGDWGAEIVVRWAPSEANS